MHTEEEALGTRLVMDTLSCLIEKEQDPSKLIAMSPGKLVRQLVKNGEHVAKGQAYAEVEVMKMMMPLLSPAAGAIAFSASEGQPLLAGELIATLDLDDPNAVTRAVEFTGSFPELGYEHPVAETLDELVACLDHPALPLLQWIEEYSFVEGRLPQAITEKLNDAITQHELELSSGLELDKPPAEFPGRQLMRVLREAVAARPPAS
ncbi:biotin carboxylase [Monoraphidium neglectum]|uniref:Biotin carboxylase n=1 Tax=Monoraphidium neglectum TaxID=145388 RepID=A0A0D2LS09_9CHLO|nr:biotin carboxylase [Monoraphidium neglectum]KIY92626.1 biotin carboxylase [Monoraphidium neglectum]|eukprot:XP_013891646.1 biotin carboxylase [Monoraphidium neglectum]